MKLRTKLLTVYVALAALPLLALSLLSYLSGARAVESLVGDEVEARAAAVARGVERRLDMHEAHLKGLAARPALRSFVRGTAAEGPSNNDVPEDVRAEFAAFFRNHPGHIESVTCLDAGGQPRLRVETGTDDHSRDAEPRFQTEHFVLSAVRYDARVRELEQPEVLRSAITQEGYGGALRLSAPVFDASGAGRPAGALIVEIRLSPLFEDADAGVGGLAPRAPETTSGPRPAATRDRLRAVIALDAQSGRIVYHTNEGLKNQQVADALPSFATAAKEGTAAGGPSRRVFYETPTGERWLAAFAPMESTEGLSVAAAANYTRAAAGVVRAGRISVAIALAACAAGILLAFLIARRASRRIERVAEGARAVAGGRLDERIDLATSGETRELAESFNLMSERLREHIAREAETKQFESFMRLSAMLTHDLKNAISGLSMLVANMERQFHREEFRADAVASLRDATDKLKRLVARLNEPVKSLSGEYRRDARSTDLVPIIRRVVAANAEPARPLYEIETKLPDSLIAVVEPERIEAVIENLVINALEAMGARGGRLTVKAGEMDEAYIYFSVADTGVGMDEEFLRLRLFRPFSTTKAKGVGLGLYTCREVVEAHGGRLEVESKPGAGTRFRAVLPSALHGSREHPRRPEKRTAATVGRDTDGASGRLDKSSNSSAL